MNHLQLNFSKNDSLCNSESVSIGKFSFTVKKCSHKRTNSLYDNYINNYIENLVQNL